MFLEVTAVNMSERSSHPDESQSEPPRKKKKSKEITDAIQQRNNDEEKASFYCVQCSKSYGTKYNLERHLKTNHQNVFARHYIFA